MHWALSSEKSDYYISRWVVDGIDDVKCIVSRAFVCLSATVCPHLHGPGFNLGSSRDAPWLCTIGRIPKLGYFYLRQGAYVIVVVCLPCLLTTLRKNFQTDLHQIFREGWQCNSEHTIKFWWRCRWRIWIRIATLVRRALAEVSTAPVFLGVHVVIQSNE